jgi:hypothetical protein
MENSSRTARRSSFNSSGASNSIAVQITSAKNLADLFEDALLYRLVVLIERGAELGDQFALFAVDLGRLPAR